MPLLNWNDQWPFITWYDHRHKIVEMQVNKCNSNALQMPIFGEISNFPDWLTMRMPSVLTWTEWGLQVGSMEGTCMCVRVCVHVRYRASERRHVKQGKFLGMCVNFLGCRTQVPNPGWLETAGSDHLTVLETKGLKSKSQQGYAPSEGSREESSLASFSLLVLPSRLWRPWLHFPLSGVSHGQHLHTFLFS